jgi:hypothetical protein
MQVWNQQIPVYVTRKTADGLTGNLSIPAWMFVLFGVMLEINVFLWLAIGIGEAIKLITS